MVGGTYTTGSAVYHLTGFSTVEVSTEAMNTILQFADADVERRTGKIWTGRQIKEFVGRGDGTTSIFYVSYPPVLSAAESAGGTVTDDPSHITVTVDGSTVDSPNYSLLGYEGRVTFADDAIPADDEKVEATYYYSLAQVKEAATFLAGAYCFFRVRGTESNEAKTLRQRAMEILDELGKKTKAKWTR